MTLAEPVSLKGFGAATCGKFAALYREFPDQAEDPFVYWGVGFMSATNAHLANIGQPSQMRDLNGRPDEEQRRVIRDYCDKHPLQLYVEAVRHLFWTLPLMPKAAPR